MLPVEGHTKLAVDQSGLRVLRTLKGPVVPAVVIGPYRSGKSFLLNQLLGVGCGESRSAYMIACDPVQQASCGHIVWSISHRAHDCRRRLWRGASASHSDARRLAVGRAADSAAQWAAGMPKAVQQAQHARSRQDCMRGLPCTDQESVMWVMQASMNICTCMQVSLLLFDTEGFESTGKADAYDDRIFALSAMLSSVLIYNLPETVRESDIEKLSFAVQLAEGFYADATVRKQDKAGRSCIADAQLHQCSPVALCPPAYQA